MPLRLQTVFVPNTEDVRSSEIIQAFLPMPQKTYKIEARSAPFIICPSPIVATFSPTIEPAHTILVKLAFGRTPLCQENLKLFIRNGFAG
jgi:hypothetical protein